jgi:hypothetical protein
MPARRSTSIYRSRSQKAERVESLSSSVPRRRRDDEDNEEKERLRKASKANHPAEEDSSLESPPVAPATNAVAEIDTAENTTNQSAPAQPTSVETASDQRNGDTGRRNTSFEREQNISEFTLDRDDIEEVHRTMKRLRERSK